MGEGLDPETLGRFLLASLLIELTPGPNMAWLASVALQRGRAGALSAVGGVTLGLALMATAAGLGLGAALDRMPGLGPALLWAGVALMGWLTLKAWQAAPPGRETSPARMTPDDADREGPFLRGLATNVVNPKALVFFTAFLPGFAAPGTAGATGRIAVLALLYLAVAVAVHVAIVLMAARLSQGSPWQAHLRRAAAWGLVGVTLWAAWAAFVASRAALLGG